MFTSLECVKQLEIFIIGDFPCDNVLGTRHFPHSVEAAWLTRCQCTKNSIYMYVSQTSITRVILSSDLYCYLLP